MVRSRATLRVVDKISLTDQITNKVAAMAEAASKQDHKTVEELVAKAKAHSPENRLVEMIEFTPSVMAIIINKYNRFNREWNADPVMAFADDMSNGRWKAIHQGYSFYTTGNWADGAHRGRAQVMSETTLTMSCYFSVRQEDIGAIDCGVARTAWMAASLDGVLKASDKESLLKAILRYDAKLKIP